VKVNPSMLSRSAIRSLMSAGRKRGIGGILATQRISKIDKDAIADARNVFIGGTTLDIDQRRAGDILGMSKAESVSLRDLDPGIFFSFGPAVDGKGIIRFTSGKVQTTHPKAGQRSSIVVPKASTQIAGIVQQFGDLPAAAEEEVKTLNSLKSENEHLRRQLRERPVTVQTQPTVERVEVPVLLPEQYDGILNSLSHLQEHAEEIKAVAQTMYAYPDEIKATLDTLKQTIQKYSAGRLHTFTESVKSHIGVDRAPGKDKTVKAVVRTADRKIESVDQITGPQQRILDAIAWLESIGLYKPSRPLVAFLAGYKNIRSTGFTNPLGNLRTYGLITYPDSDSVDMTESGRAAANMQTPPRTTDELHRMVLARLSGPQGRVLRPLIECYPNAMDRHELAKLAGYSNIRSTGFTNPLGNLRTYRLIDYPTSTEAIALPVLFLE